MALTEPGVAGLSSQLLGQWNTFSPNQSGNGSSCEVYIVQLTNCLIGLVNVSL